MGHKIRISPWACIFFSLLLLTVPFRWWLGASVAACFHELSHLLAIRLTGGQVTGIFIGGFGAKIEVLPMNRSREALCALAGPLGSVLFSLLFPFFPEAAIFASVQAMYNLLPVYPLDGGRLLGALLPKKICNGVETAAMVLLLGLGIWYCAAKNGEILTLISGSAVLIRMLTRKIPCKEPKMAVQ